MKLFRHILYLVMFLVALSCHREENVDPAGSRVPDGQPVTLKIGFGGPSMLKVDIGTKAEASRADEAYVHDLYVMIFDEDNIHAEKESERGIIDWDRTYFLTRYYCI